MNDDIKKRNIENAEKQVEIKENHPNTAQMRGRRPIKLMPDKYAVLGAIGEEDSFSSLIEEGYGYDFADAVDTVLETDHEGVEVEPIEIDRDILKKLGETDSRSKELADVANITSDPKISENVEEDRDNEYERLPRAAQPISAGAGKIVTPTTQVAKKDISAGAESIFEEITKKANKIKEIDGFEKKSAAEPIGEETIENLIKELEEEEKRLNEQKEINIKTSETIRGQKQIIDKAYSQAGELEKENRRIEKEYINELRDKIDNVKARYYDEVAQGEKLNKELIQTQEATSAAQQQVRELQDKKESLLRKVEDIKKNEVIPKETSSGIEEIPKTKRR